MTAQARITSKGQITIPKSVREELGLREGDSVVFRIEDARAVISKTPNFLELAGSVPTPPGKEGLTWEEIRQEARQALARKYA